MAAALLAAAAVPAVAAASGIALGDPVVVAMTPAAVRDWGPYQFPSLERLPDGRLCVSVHVEADSALAYGLPCLQAISTDAGRTWSVLPEDGPESGRVPSFSYALELPRGERLVMHRPRPLKAGDLALPDAPFGTCISYGASHVYYRIADLPPECRDGWLLERFSPGKATPTREKAAVQLPGERRYTVSGVMPLPWYTGHRMRLAPDGAIWCFGEDRRDVGGVFDRQARIIVMRSADGGRTLDFWSEIPYAPDRSAASRQPSPSRR